MERILAADGFLVRTAADGVAGLELARQDVPDLILCDIMMPGMNGYEFFALLQQDELLKEVSFMFVTAMSSRTSIRRAMSSGIDDYLTKPFSPQELIEAVTGRLNRTRNRRLGRDVRQ
jgi:CheY-like chemotaxis protein